MNRDKKVVVLDIFGRRFKRLLHQGLWTADALPPRPLPLSLQLHAGFRASPSHRIKTFLHHCLFDHLHHFIKSRSLNSQCIIEQCRDEEKKNEKRERKRRVRRTHWNSQIVSDAYINGPPLFFCLFVFSIYFSLFTVILKDLSYSFCV